MRKAGVIIILGCALVLIQLSTINAIPIPTNVSVSGHLPGLQNEEQVWICPHNSSTMITNHRDFRLGYRQIGLGYSHDGGQTWIDTLIHPDFQLFTHQSDPTMTIGSNGDIIISHLDYRRGVSPRDSSYISFMISSDCGDSWEGPYTVVDTIGPWFEDKQFITADRTGGPHDGNVYVAWARFYTGELSHILFARSTDGGRTFEDTLEVGPKITPPCLGYTLDAGQFAQPLVGKDGSVYVFYTGREVTEPECNVFYAILMNKSTDGGVTWEGTRILTRVYGHWQDINGNIPVYSMSVTDADITDGPHAGNLYLQYRTHDYDHYPDWHGKIYFKRSLDNGLTWSDSIRVNDDPLPELNEQFHNWMVCNQEGILVSIWYDQRTDPNNYLFDVFAGYSYDGGVSWTSNHRISDVSIDPSLLPSASMAKSRDKVWNPDDLRSPMQPMAGLIAEYIGLSCLRDTVVATWTDTRYGDQDVMSAAWELPLTDPRILGPDDGITYDPVTDTLKWATAWKEWEDLYRIQIAYTPDFNPPLVDEYVEEPTLDFEDYGPFGCSSFYWRVKALKAPGGVPTDSTVFTEPRVFFYDVCADDCGDQQGTDPNAVGDVNCDGSQDPLDVQVLANFVFLERDARCIKYLCAYESGDVNCDATVDPLDVQFLVKFVFLSQDAMCDPIQ